MPSVRPFAAGVLLAIAASAHAEIVTLTFDVLPTSAARVVEFQGEQASEPVPDFGVVPFSLTVRFDSAQPYLSFPVVYQTPSYFFTDAVYARGEGGSTTFTPYTPFLAATLPPADTAVDPLSTQVAQHRSLYLDNGQPVGMEESMGINTGLRWDLSTDTENVTATYQLGLNWRTRSAPVAKSDFGPLLDGALIDWLNTQVGVVHVGAYSEASQYTFVDLLPDGVGVFRGYERLAVTGDIRLTSVTAVPEPTQIALYALGLPLMWGAVRRGRRATQRH